MRKDVEGDWWKWLNNKKVTQLMDKGYKRNTKQKQLEYFKKLEIQIKTYYLLYV